MRGEWRILERDAETLEAMGERCVHNVLTDVALPKFAQGLYDPRQLTQSYTYHGAVCATIIRPYWYIVLGTGAGVPDSGDTNLFTATAATSRHATKTRTGNVVKYVQRYMPEEENGLTYTEAGIFEWVPWYEWSEWNDPEEEDFLIWHYDPRPYSYGTLLNHVLLDPPLEKTELKLMDFEVRVTFY